MRVAVVGAGIVGVCTAYELVAMGADVTVFEAHSSVAAEGSFANAGLLSPGWAAAQRDPILKSTGARLSHLRWLWRAARATRAEARSPQNPGRRALHALAQLSHQRVLELARTLRLEFDQTPGCLLLLKTERELKAAEPALALLRDLGVAHDVVDAARCRTLEPNLNPATPLHAAVHLPQDGVGNCRQFAHLLKAQAQRLGVRFDFERRVQQAQGGPSPQLKLQGGSSPSFDQIVLCSGAGSAALLRATGAKLPLARVASLSVTAPLRVFDGLPRPGPRAGLIDWASGIAFARLGQRLRVSGAAELGAVDAAAGAAAASQAGLTRLYRALDDWFPGATLPREQQQWVGVRTHLPDGRPVLGASGSTGLWLNVGHGALGWTLACGAARVLAEQMTGRAAPIDTTGLGAERWRG